MKTSWHSPKIFPTITTDEIHVWVAVLDFSEDKLADFYKTFSEHEQTRAKHFHFEKDRKRFIGARGVLRTLLSQYIIGDPKNIQFTYSSHGKPALVNDPSLRFNVSHSQNVALFAFSKQYELGVDIETMEKSREIVAIAKRFFTANESKLIDHLKGKAQNQAFFNGWTRKEAFLKALGMGLSYPLKQVEVTMSPEDPAKFIALYDKNLNMNDWSLYNLKYTDNFAAALVVKGIPNRISLFKFHQH